MLSVSVLCLAVVVSTRPTSAQPTVDQQNEAAAKCNCDTKQEIFVAIQRNVMDLQNFVRTKFSEIDAERLVNCPTDFTQVPSVNGCYKLIVNQTTWQNAAAQCRSMHKDSDLVVINSYSEHNAIVNLISQQFSGISVWTAGQRIDPTTKSTFVWKVRRASSSTNVRSSEADTVILAMMYTNWYRGEPSYSSRRESCLELGFDFNYTWNDNDCSDHNLALCEIGL
jgi:hypothetical protein